MRATWRRGCCGSPLAPRPAPTTPSATSPRWTPCCSRSSMRRPRRRACAGCRRRGCSRPGSSPGRTSRSGWRPLLIPATADSSRCRMPARRTRGFSCGRWRRRWPTRSRGRNPPPPPVAARRDWTQRSSGACWRVASLGAMPRTWPELVLTDRDLPADNGGAPEGQEQRRGGFFRRLRESMSKTRDALGAEIQATVFGPLNDETWERLEETLIYADVGAQTTAKIVERLETEATSGDLSGGEQLQGRLTELLAEAARVGEPMIDLRQHPAVVLVVGVNGTGKTTTIGKLAWHLQQELGLSVLLGAADTYRAAAVDQLEIWAERAGCEIVRAEQGSDPGAVAFDAVAAAEARGKDVVIIDTAGRLHTQTNLMDELQKVRRVIEKRLPGAPHETLLSIDATTGQNGLRQALLFREAVEISGIALTKLDGTAKGGIALAIAQELSLPVKLIGIGEKLEDLRPFDADDFARAILDA